MLKLYTLILLLSVARSQLISFLPNCTSNQSGIDLITWTAFNLEDIQKRFSYTYENVGILDVVLNALNLAPLCVSLSLPCSSNTFLVSGLENIAFDSPNTILSFEILDFGTVSVTNPVGLNSCSETASPSKNPSSSPTSVPSRHPTSQPTSNPLVTTNSSASQPSLAEAEEELNITVLAGATAAGFSVFLVALVLLLVRHRRGKSGNGKANQLPTAQVLETETEEDALREIELLSEMKVSPSEDDPEIVLRVEEML